MMRFGAGSLYGKGGAHIDLAMVFSMFFSMFLLGMQKMCVCVCVHVN